MKHVSLFLLHVLYIYIKCYQYLCYFHFIRNYGLIQNFPGSSDTIFRTEKFILLAFKFVQFLRNPQINCSYMYHILALLQATKSITTPQEFIVQWRHIKSSSTSDSINTNGALLELLFNQDNELLENLFNTGLGVSFLPEILSVLNHSVDNTDTILSSSDCNISIVISKVSMILASFQRSKQFSLAVDCLLDSEKETAHHLVEKIKDIANKYELFEDDGETLKKIADTFKR